MSSNTPHSFKDKWENNTDLAFRETLDPTSEIHRWIIGRNGFADDDAFRRHLAGRKRLLDAGCGNGRVTALLSELAPADSDIVGLDLVAAKVAIANLAALPNITIHAKDMLGDLSSLGRFDFIYCQEVLHHTADPRGGLLNLASLLEPGGELAIYVYKQKAPAREFVDDFVRDRIAHLPYDEAMVVCRQITELGKTLNAVPASVTVADLPLMGIEAGDYSIQRFFYHFFMKCFWNDEMSFEDNAAINYDWYHPQLATRHSRDEVFGWFRDAGLTVVHELVDPYGITMRGVRE